MKNQECKVREEVINVNTNNPMSWSNQTKQIKWHENCVCRLISIVSNNKQRWSKDKCKCECKE